ncbi:PBP1A family penicillin-binding protein [Bacillus timonensis]|nr:PBP1A family penicillin-binding protein [Bacillus timonensis]
METITGRRLKSTIKYIRALIILGSLFAILSFLFFIGIFTYAKAKGAPPLAVPLSTLIYASDGTLIGESHNGGQKRYWVTLDEISPAVINATIAIEDRQFFNHNGFDYKRIAGAALADIRAMAKVQGASTITQQYARNLFLAHEKTWNRKITEALYTIRLEMNYDKKEILEGYLNTIYYGEGAYGIEAAANHYFGKSAKELNISEASMLAGIPKGPSHYSPFNNPDKAKARQNIVLKSMVAAGYLSDTEAKDIYLEKLIYTSNHQVKREQIAPYYQDIVISQLKNSIEIDKNILKMGGLRVYTSLEPKMQKLAEEVVASTMSPATTLQLGFVAMNPYNGEVLALIGGRDYSKSTYNRVTQAERQPGSTIKPLLYYAAIEQGFTPSTEMRSEVTKFTFDDGRATYTPHNYNNYYAHDTITLAQAMALSDNVYAVKTHLFLGEETLIKTAKKFGVTSKLDKVPSLALGTSSVKVIDMVGAYATLANNGKKTKPIFITKIVDHKGEIIYESKKRTKQVLDPKSAFVTTHMMTGMFDEKLNDYTSVTGSTVKNMLTRFYAGKSGTTKTDSWMIGFSPHLVAGIWTGYDKNESIDLVAERSYAKDIWAIFMEKAHKGMPVKPFLPPEGVIGVYVNPDNGKLATKSCPVSRLTYYTEGTEPTEYCTDHLDTHEQPKIEEPRNEEESQKGWFKRIFDWF